MCSTQEFIENFKKSSRDWLQPYLKGDSGLNIAASLAEFIEIREIFFTLSNLDQMNVSMAVRNGVSPDVMAGSIRILRQTERQVTDFAKLVDHIYNEYSDILKNALQSRGPFYTALAKFDKAQLNNVHSPELRGSLHSIDLQLAMIDVMREAHTEEKIIDAVEVWANNSTGGSFYDFVILTERWGEFKEYPWTGRSIFCEGRLYDRCLDHFIVLSSFCHCSDLLLRR